LAGILGYSFEDESKMLPRGESEGQAAERNRPVVGHFEASAEIPLLSRGGEFWAT